jgi:transposase InsO family protein
VAAALDDLARLDHQDQIRLADRAQAVREDDAGTSAQQPSERRLDAAESFFATLILELIYRQLWTTRSQATRAIFEFIAGWYDHQRRHSAGAYRSPADVEQHSLFTALAAQSISPPERVKAIECPA